MWNNCPYPYSTMLCKDFLDRPLYTWSRAFWMSQIPYRIQWIGTTCPRFLQIAQETGIHIFLANWYLYQDFTIKVKIPVSLAIIVLLSTKVGANFKVFRCPRSFQIRFRVNGEVCISKTGFLNEANRSTECHSRTLQNCKSEQSITTVPGFGVILI